MYQPKESTWEVESSNIYQEVSDYIAEQIKKIPKIQRSLRKLKEFFKNYIIITKNYCDQITVLVSKITPLPDSIAGNLTQVIQGILLFNSILLETKINELEAFFRDLNEKEYFDVHELKEYNKTYQTSLSELITNYCVYIDEFEKYEKYLMNKEMGINLNDSANSKNENIDDKKLDKKSNISLKNEQFELKNNIADVLEARKNYFDKIEPMNNLMNKLVNFGINEENNLNEEIYNISNFFIDKLKERSDNQMKKYQEQSSFLKELNEKIKSKKFKELNSGIQHYSLHCINIYINSRNLARNNDKKEIENLNKKIKDFEIYKNISLDNIDNIIKEIKKNGLDINEKDLKNYEVEKVKNYIFQKIKAVGDEADENFNSEDKDKLIQYFKEDEKYGLYLLQLMNNDRYKSGKIINKNIFNYLCEIFKCMNDLTLEKNNYTYFKYISVISMTYYINENDKKIYIYEFLKDNEKLKDIQFWENYAKTIIDLDMKRVSSINEQYKSENGDKVKINSITFGHILSICNIMVSYELDENFIAQFIILSQKKYSLTDEQIKEIQNLKSEWIKNQGKDS